MSTFARDLNPDRPISDPKDDRLGFSGIALNLARAIVDSSAIEGLVVGIEGLWGSGKSSVLNLVCSELSDQSNVTVIRFEPWTIGNRDELVASLIGDIASAVAEVERKAEGKVSRLGRGTTVLADRLRSYGASTSRGLAPIAKLAAILGVPHAELASKGLLAGAEALNRESKAVPLSKRKSDVVSGLRQLDHRFIVAIDDLDRLEPEEAVEVLRLVRAVGDFPNIVYLLCYERQVLSRSLQSAVKVDDGDAFLQKIIQVSFRIPRPEEFDLRRWFFEECNQLYTLINGESLRDGDVLDRLSKTCGAEGQYLQTPRDIAQVLNALRLHYPPVANQVDFPDLCALQTMRLKDKELYDWIEKYLTTVAVLIEREGMVSESEREEFGRGLSATGIRSHVASFKSLWRLKELVPGIEPGQDRPSKVVFGRVGEQARAELEANRRLGSSQHYRLYFSFARPAGALDDAIIFSMVSRLSRGDNVVPDLLLMIEERRPQGGTKYDVLVDRLARRRFEDKPSSKVILRNLISAIGDTIDVAQRTVPGGFAFGRRSNSENARGILVNYLSLLSEEERGVAVDDMFSNRTSIGWLLGDIIGKELFAQGRVGDRAVPESEWLLKSSELDGAIRIMHKRLDGPERRRILEVPDLMSFIYRWRQSGAPTSAQEWCVDQMSTDAGFIALLSRCRGWRASDKVYFPLNRRDISTFADFDDAVERLKRIASDTAQTQEIRDEASDLIEAARIGNSTFGDSE